MIRALAPLVAAFACLAVACNSSGGDDDDPTALPAETETVVVATGQSCEPPRAASPGQTTATVTSGGIERSYILHIPPSYDGSTQYPLVMLFNGFSLPADAFATYTAFDEVADANDTILVFPVGQGEPATWNTNQDVTIADDVQFANDLLDELDATLCIDPDRIFVAGYSDGAAMAQRVACDTPERVAALATVASTYLECRAAVPWVAFHGVDDTIVPFEGGDSQGRTLQPVRRIVSDWARELGCDGLAQISRPTDSVELSTYTNCVRGTGEVLLYALIRAGHTWPGASDLPVDLVGATSKQIDGSATIWEFFSTHPRVQ